MAIIEGHIGHICIYLHEGEVHLDLPAFGQELTPAEFAEAVAQVVYDSITLLQEDIANAQSSGPSVQQLH